MESIELEESDFLRQNILKVHRLIENSFFLFFLKCLCIFERERETEHEQREGTETERETQESETGSRF